MLNIINMYTISYTIHIFINIYIYIYIYIYKYIVITTYNNFNLLI